MAPCFMKYEKFNSNNQKYPKSFLEIRVYGTCLFDSIGLCRKRGL